jgi:CMP-N-acetylneuraminic acid synthetase
MPLQAGDNGVQSVQNITSTVSTAGTFNVMILRSLLADGVRVRSTNDGDTFDMARTGLMPIYDNTALYMMVTPDSTNTGLPSVSMEIASK